MQLSISQKIQFGRLLQIFEFGCELFNFTPEIDVCATAQDKKCELFIGENEKYNWSSLNPDLQMADHFG